MQFAEAGNLNTSRIIDQFAVSEIIHVVYIRPGGLARITANNFSATWQSYLNQPPCYLWSRLALKYS